MARGPNSRDPGFRVIASLTDKFTKPIQGINKQIAQSTAKLRGIAAVPGAIMRSSGLDKIGGAFANVGTQVGRLRSSVTGLLRPFTQLGLVAGGFGLVKFTTDAVKLGGELIKLKNSTGISVEALQGLQYAAAQSGVSADELGAGLNRLNLNVRSAIKGGKQNAQIIEVFRKGIGLTVNDLKRMKPDEVFLKTARAIANMTDETNKQETAYRLFGRQGVSLLALLNEGEDGILAFVKALEESGAVMTEDTARDAKNFSDIMLELQQSVKGIAYAVLHELLPGMTGSAEAMREWTKENREWLKDEVIKVVRSLVQIARAFVRIVMNDIIPAIKALEPLWRAFESIVGEGNAKLLAFTAVVAPGVIGAVLGIGKALFLLGLALVANPIGATILGIGAAVGFLGYSIYQERHAIAQGWEDIKTSFSDGVARVRDNLNEFREDLPETWGEAWERVKTTSSTLWKDIGTGAASAWAQLTGNIKEAVSNIDLSAMGDSVEQAFHDVVAWINGFRQQLRDVIVKALTDPIGFVKEAWNGLVSFLQGVWESIKGIFSRGQAEVGGPPKTTAQEIYGGSRDTESDKTAMQIYGGSRDTRTAQEIYGGAREPDVRTAQQIYGGAPEEPAKKPGWLQRNLPSWAGGGAAPAPAAAAQTSRSEVTVNFDNLPTGARVTENISTGNTDLTLNTAYAGPRGAVAGAY